MKKQKKIGANGMHLKVKIRHSPAEYLISFSRICKTACAIFLPFCMFMEMWNYDIQLCCCGEKKLVKSFCFSFLCSSIDKYFEEFLHNFYCVRVFEREMPFYTLLTPY